MLIEVVSCCKNGSELYNDEHIEPLRDVNGNSTHHFAIRRDVTAPKVARELLPQETLHDPLTGLPNRTLFLKRLEQAVARTKQHPSDEFAVLFLDLDHFKMVNDGFGCAIGDRLLIAIGQRLKTCLRPTDTVARLGGDEFTFLLEEIRDISDAAFVAQQIQQELAQPFILEGHEVFITASIGITLGTSEYAEPETLLRDAHTAMARAKAQERVCYAVFDPTMHDDTVTRLQSETDLRRALERQELQLHYQPIVSLKTGKIAGFEALVRWQHPERGAIAPTEFIPLAEETGLIHSLFQWVLREACHQMQTWHRQFPTAPLTISVNVSSKQLTRPDLVQQVGQILQETGLNPNSLKLEITESVVIEEGLALASIEQLRALGVQLYIDDFGTGYSSLSYLLRFPFDALKIDRSFVTGIGVDGGNREIVRTITALAHTLGMEVITEGVETSEQLIQLQELQCEYGQGFYFSQPVDSNAAETLLAAALNFRF